MTEALSRPSALVRQVLAMADTWTDRPRRAEATTRVSRTARQLRPAEIDELVAAYRDGERVRSLATRFGISRGTVGQHLRARGIDTTPPGLHPDDVPEAVRLYEAGWSLARLGEKFGTTANTVRARLLEAGVRTRRPWEHVIYS